GAYPNPTPPPAFVDAPTTTKEGTKVIPDNLLTPGSHIEFFLRRSNASDPGTPLAFAPDTGLISPQPSAGGDLDQLRWEHADVLPDLWKDLRFGGNGLACILYVDAADRRGIEPSVRGALD